MTCSGVFIVNFVHISDLFSSVSIVDTEHINVSWEYTRTSILRKKFFSKSGSWVLRIYAPVLDIIELVIRGIRYRKQLLTTAFHSWIKGLITGVARIPTNI